MLLALAGCGDNPAPAAKAEDDTSAPGSTAAFAPGEYLLDPGAVSCGLPVPLGLARVAWRRLGNLPGDRYPEVLQQILRSGQCIPPIKTDGPPIRYHLDHIETVPWRGSLDGQTWLSGNLSVAELRTEFNGVPVITYAAAEDLRPQATTIAPAPAPAGAMASDTP